MTLAIDDPRHGTSAGHNAGCRCQGCCAAKLRYDKRRKYELATTGQRRVVPSYRAVRRIHALQALGYSGRVIAEDAGMVTKTLYDISLERSTHTRRAHFDLIAASYERLAGTVPTGRYVGRNRAYALRRGWPPPLAWDDIDDPAETPTGWQYFPAGRGEVLVDLLDRGASLADACRHLHVSEDSLQKWCGNHDLSHVYRALAARLIRNTNQHLLEAS